MLGWAAMIGNAAIAYADEAEAGSGARIITVNFVGARSSAVALHFKVDGNDASAKSAIVLLESLKRKMAEQGFERLHADDDWQEVVHGYEVFIVGDTGYSMKTHTLERREGHLLALVVENDKMNAVVGAPANGSDLGYQQIEKMADEIIKLLVKHSFI